MLKVAITGGIGSGKTIVTQVFKQLGIPVYDADAAAKRLMNEDEALKLKIKQTFGANIYEQEKLDRKKLAAIVFQHPGKLKELNAIVHPATITDGTNWMAAQTTPYAIKEAAILFESGSDKYVDQIIGVTAPEELRIQRVQQRDGISAEEVLARISKQMNEEEKMRRCNFVLHNDEQQLLLPQIITVHEQLLALSS